jgi:hypothetical protein
MLTNLDGTEDNHHSENNCMIQVLMKRYHEMKTDELTFFRITCKECKNEL